MHPYPSENSAAAVAQTRAIDSSAAEPVSTDVSPSFAKGSSASAVAPAALAIVLVVGGGLKDSGELEPRRPCPCDPRPAGAGKRGSVFEFRRRHRFAPSRR